MTGRRTMRTTMIGLGFWMMGLVLTLILAVGCGTSASTCKPGEQGCACVAQACNSGLACVAGTCAPEQLAGLAVDGPARGCEVLLGESGGKVDRVDFGADVTGRWLRQGDKGAAAFVANRDMPIGSSAVQVGYAGGSFAVVNSHCYGSRGEELPGATVHR